MAFVERPPEPYLPEEEQPVKPWQVGLVEFDQDEAREAYVGEKYEKFAELFDSFDDSDDFKFSFIWPPLVFGWLWFLYRQMYQEGLLVFFVTIFIGFFLPSFFPGSDLVVSLFINLALSLCGGWLYYHKTENQIERALALYSGDSSQVMGWLRRTGGVSGWVIFVGIAYVLLKLYFLFLEALGTAVGEGISRSLSGG